MKKPKDMESKYHKGNREGVTWKNVIIEIFTPFVSPYFIGGDRAIFSKYFRFGFYRVQEFFLFVSVYVLYAKIDRSRSIQANVCRYGKKWQFSYTLYKENSPNWIFKWL